MMRHARRQKPKRGHPNLNRVYAVDFPPIEDECTGSASGSDDASAGSDGESGDTQDIVVMSGDGGRDEAHECDSSYQGSPNFSDSNGAEGTGHGDDKEEGHDRDGSDEAGDGHRVYRHPHFRPGYQLNTLDCFMLYCGLRGLPLSAYRRDERLYPCAFDQLVARIKKR